MNIIRHIIDLFVPTECYPSYIDKLEDTIEKLKAIEDYNIDLQTIDNQENKEKKEFYYKENKKELLIELINIANETINS